MLGPTGILRAAGGLGVLVAALGLGVILVEDPPPAKMSSQLRSGRDPAPAGLAGVGQGLVPGGTQGSGSYPDGRPVLQGPGGSLSHPEGAGGHPVLRGAGLLLCGASRSVPRWPQWWQMPPPVGATRLQGLLAGQRGHHCSAAEKNPTQYDPDTKNVVSPTSESQDIPQGPSPRDPHPPSLPLLLVPRLNWHLSQGLGGTEPSWPPRNAAEPIALPGHPTLAPTVHGTGIPHPEAGGNQGRQ